MEASEPAASRDLGPPVAYTALPVGVVVLDRDGGQVGTVRRVLGDEATAIFDGLVLDTPGGERFVDAPEVDRLHERGVLLTLDAAGVAGLKPPSPSPVARRVHGPEDLGGGSGLRGLWGRMTGRR